MSRFFYIPRPPQTLIRFAYNRHLAPGGYIELKDILLTPKSDDGTLSRGSPLCEWANNLANAARQLGRPLIGNASEYERILIEEGFEVIEVREHKLPTNLWPEDETMKAIGYLTSKTTGQELEAISLARFVHSLGWDVTNALMSCALARKVFQSRAVHAYFPYITVLGKKPEAV